MMLSLILVLFFGGIAAWYSERLNPAAPRFIALATLFIEALLVLMQYSMLEPFDYLPTGGSQVWLDDLHWEWISRFGIGFHLAMDGLSLLLITLTVMLGFMALGSSWTEINRRQGFFYFNLLSCLAGTVGVFLAVDLFLFFFFWEVMILPMYFMIRLWGHENSIYAANKFFIFTQVSGLLMLLAIISLALIVQDKTGTYSFDYFDLLKVPVDSEASFWLMLGFFVAFTVKLPAVPFHVWLPDAHTQAPTGGSIILAGVLLKTGAYGLLRFVMPLFPEAAHCFAPVAMSLGAISILYAAIMAFAQSDLKRLIAYTSVSHMGFVLLGIFSFNLLALEGSVITMLAHGISAAALFMIAGSIQERLHSREMGDMGGLWSVIPKLSAMALFFAIASLGLPGLANFAGEFLVLLGAFKVNMVLTVLASLALILAPLYALIIIQKAFHGPLHQAHQLSDLNRRELASFALLVLSTVWLGLHPQSVLDIAVTPLQQLIRR